MVWVQNIQNVVIASRPPSWTFGPILFGIGIVHSRQVPRSPRALALAALQIFSLSFPLSIGTSSLRVQYPTDKHQSSLE
jgi:hypothetical protein